MLYKQKERQLTMIKEAYVSYEVAKLLKEKGFDSCIYTCYSVEDYPEFMTMIDYVVQDEIYERIGKDCHIIQAPTLQMAMRWLRETTNYELNVFCSSVDENVKRYYSYDIYNVVDVEEKSHQEHGFNTYEEACEAAIKYCLENLI